MLVPTMKMAVDSCLDDVHYFLLVSNLVTLLLSIIYEGGEYQGQVVLLLSPLSASVKSVVQFVTSHKQATR